MASTPPASQQPDPAAAPNDHPTARRSNVLRHAEATFDPLPFDAAAARAFGLISSAVLVAGRKPRRRLADLMIASVAYANGLPLYTTNPDDFAGLEGLLAVSKVPRRR